MLQVILSLPAWGAWIEMVNIGTIFMPAMSLPAWGAWIEILCLCGLRLIPSVAPRVGSVD